MQVKTIQFDDFPEELYVTYHEGTLSIGTATGAISSAFVEPLEPEVLDLLQTEPIPEPEPEADAGEEPEHIESEV
ncbi:hypothetical protein CH274_13130 [Rhodococcus sp. 06-418-5]|uniref:hypothetical protein n=1 Tax=Rhodococcus sp. 06-418-5 TaxID=2022507 RepID=UPI000B9B4BFB|nr:hypothetical protein [Rhodococcus sp. 06-418-5]OZC80174.1 hypothetical protein CH274_13130 [Rhodococcus sp. 06-418-5]